MGRRQSKSGSARKRVAPTLPPLKVERSGAGDPRRTRGADVVRSRVAAIADGTFTGAVDQEGKTLWDLLGLVPEDYDEQTRAEIEAVGRQVDRLIGGRR